MFDRELMKNSMSAGEPSEYDMMLMAEWFGANKVGTKEKQ
jgi:hypothetical protein